jgi:RimJ/RimL family protein N-acetyltransferase
MTIDFELSPVPFDAIREDVRRHLAALPGSIDSFVEDHILASNHYRIVVAGEDAGFAAIHREQTITQFALAAAHQHLGQPVFARLRRWEQVQAALVPTCVPFFLAHALDDYRVLEKQAYLFVESATSQWPGDNRYRLRPAEPGDVDLIHRETGDFFAPVERYLAARALFVTLHGEEPVGFGLVEQSRLNQHVASVGMYTSERFRREGVGTETITLLIAECHRRGLRPVAGCWYYNHASKRTLERAGMFAPTRLLRIAY